MARKRCPDVGAFRFLAGDCDARQIRKHYKIGAAVLKRWAMEHGVTITPTKRGRKAEGREKSPDVCPWCSLKKRQRADGSRYCTCGWKE